MLTQHSWQRAFQLGWRNLWRDFRSGELNLLVISVVLAVAALTAVGFFSDRLQAGLWRDARQLLGGDAVVVSDKPTAANFQQKAEALGLKTNATLSFHLKELVQASLLVVERQSRNLIYRPNVALVTNLSEFLLENCCSGKTCAIKKVNKKVACK